MIFVGLSLGLIGGGGSILTVPILVYLFSIPSSRATGLSLFVVGVASVLGAVAFYRQGQVKVQVGLRFVIPSMIAAFAARLYIVPNLPATIAGLPKDRFLLVVFALLMLTSAFRMLQKVKEPGSKTIPLSFPLEPVGLLVGLVAGIVGAGGGFLIIPALVLIARLPMKEAVGTSLFVIAIQSLVGFSGEAFRTVIPWSFLCGVTAVALLGTLVGSKLAAKTTAKGLQRAFGVFVLVLGVFILSKELLFS